MYLHTNYSLLKPIYSLLTKPFDFSAQNSIKNLKYNMKYYYKDLELLAESYDEEKVRLKPKLGKVCYSLESYYKCRLKDDFSSSNLELDNLNFLDIHSIQVQIERLYDYFNLKTEGKNALCLNDHEYMSFINLFRMNELLSLCISGSAKVRSFKRKMIFSPADSYSRDLLYSTWFARYLELSNNLSMIKYILDFSKLSNGRVNEDFVDFIFDRIFSIKFSDVPYDGHRLKSVKMILLTIRLVAYMTFYFLSNKSNSINLNVILKEFSGEKEDISYLIELQKKQLVSERFLFEENGFLRLNITTFIKSIRSFFNKLSEEFSENAEREYLLGGKFFEINSIKNRIKDLDYQERYIIFDGINRGDVEVQNELDIEYIIYDKYEDYYYFIQSKYSIFGERGYFEGEVKQIQSDILKGLKQLRSAKGIFDKGDLMLALCKLGIKNATYNNSCFVLLHNIPQLDFQITIDKIALYDWNTFRNLLKNGECFINNKFYRLNRNIILNEPHKVINILLSEHEIYSSIKNDIEINNDLINKFYFADKEIIVAGLGV